MKLNGSTSLASTLFALAALLVCGSAQALSFDDVPDSPGIAAKASIAFRGTVVDVRYATAVSPASGTTVPYTVYSFSVDRGYRNAGAGQLVTLFQYGGPIDTETWESAPGLPTLEIGEMVAIFSNDTRQFAFASLYAEAGLRRFVWNGRQMMTLSANWTALAQYPEASGLQAEDMRECEPAAGDPTQCVAWIDVDEQSHSTPFPSTSNARALSVDEFDRQVDKWIAESPAPTSQPAQTLDEAAFATKLAMFIDATSQPALMNDHPLPQ